MKRATLLLTILLLNSLSIFTAEIESPEFYDELSLATGDSRSVGDGSTDVPVSMPVGDSGDATTLDINKPYSDGTETVNEVTGKLELRYTDLSFPGVGKVNLKLDRVYGGEGSAYYQIATNWSFDLPYLKCTGTITYYSNITRKKYTLNINSSIEEDITTAVDKGNYIILRNTDLGANKRSISILNKESRDIITFDVEVGTIKIQKNGGFQEVTTYTGTNKKIYHPDGTISEFNVNGLITSIKDLNNQNSIVYEYDKKITKITDAAGRVFTFNYELDEAAVVNKSINNYVFSSINLGTVNYVNYNIDTEYVVVGSGDDRKWVAKNTLNTAYRSGAENDLISFEYGSVYNSKITIKYGSKLSDFDFSRGYTVYEYTAGKVSSSKSYIKEDGSNIKLSSKTYEYETVSKVKSESLGEKLDADKTYAKTVITEKDSNNNKYTRKTMYFELPEKTEYSKIVGKVLDIISEYDPWDEEFDIISYTYTDYVEKFKEYYVPRIIESYGEYNVKKDRIVLEHNKYGQPNEVVRYVYDSFNHNNVIYQTTTTNTYLHEKSNSPLSYGLLESTKIVDNKDSSKTNTIEISYGYDERLNLETTTIIKNDPGNNITDRKITTTNYYNSNNTLDYTESHNQTVSSEGVLVSYEYDDDDNKGLPTKINIGNKKETTYEYDDKGRLKSYIESTGQLKYEYEYDHYDRIKTVKKDSKVIYVYHYIDTNDGYEYFKKDIEENIVVETLDGYRRVVSLITYTPEYSNANIPNLHNNFKTSSITNVYHPVHKNLVTESKIWSKGEDSETKKEYFYDKLGRLVRSDVDGEIVSSKYYNDKYNIVKEIYYNKNNHNKTVSRKDWNGNIVRQYKYIDKESYSAQNGVGTFYYYDSFGNNTHMILAKGTSKEQVYDYEYDNLGNLVKMTYPDDSTEKYSYTNDGNIETYTDRKGQETSYTYRPYYGLVHEITSSDRTITKMYGSNLKESSVFTKNNGKIVSNYSFMYNTSGLLELETKVIEGKKYEVKRTYNDLNEVIEQTTTTPNETRTIKYVPVYDYDSYVNRTKVTDINGNNITDIRLTPLATIKDIKYGNGVITTYSSVDDLFLRPTKIEAKIGGTTLMNLGYTYDYLGNVLQTKDNSHTKDYEYDGMSRLVDNDGLHYTYDELDNRSNENNYEAEKDITLSSYSASVVKAANSITIRSGFKTNGKPFRAYVHGKTYKYKNNNKMIISSYDGWTFTHDVNGNMTSKSKNGSDKFNYIYDSNNQLIEVKKNNNTGGQYKYDNNGHRIYKKEDGKVTLYVYSGNSILVEETYNEDLAVNDSYTYNVLFHGKNVAKYVNGVIEYHLLDHLGSRKVTVDRDRNVIDNVSYSAFGGKESGSDENYSFTGKQLDSSTGLVYFNARYYDTDLGRFITQDPIKDGLNWYVYCENNPLKFVDPTGLENIVGTDISGKVISERNYNPSVVNVSITRDHSGYGNEFNSTRTIDSITMKNGQKMKVGFSDDVGANAASENFAKKHNGFTKPDGDYQLSGNGLTKNADGTFDSNSYKNVLRYTTNDPNISADIRRMINEGCFLAHGTENKFGDSWTKPWSAGCDSPPGGQDGQDSFMNQLPRGGAKIHVNIESKVNQKPAEAKTYEN